MKTVAGSQRITGTPVSEFRFLPFGRVTVIDAEAGDSFDFTPAKARELVGCFAAWNRDLQIDYDHQAVGLAPRADGTAPAAGWIGGMEIRKDGVYATNVRWTDEAAGLLASGKYRYFSPVVFWESKAQQHITGVGPAALTNHPAISGSPALVASQNTGRVATRCAPQQLEFLDSPATPAGAFPARLVAASTQGSDHMDQIAQLVGLSAGSTVDQILAALTADNLPAVAQALGLDAGVDRQEVERMLKDYAKRAAGGNDNGGGGGGGGSGNNAKENGTAQLMSGRRQAVATIAAGLGLVGIDAEEALIAAVKPRLGAQTGVDPATVAGMVTRIKALEDKIEDQEFELICASGKGRGKIAPSMRETFKTIFSTNRKTFDDMVERLPTLAGDKSAFENGDKANETPKDRSALIAAGRRAFVNENAKATVLCSERVFVDQALRDAKQPALTDAEVKDNSIAA